MEKIIRQKELDFLKKNAKKWNKEWCDNYTKKKSSSVKSFDGETVNKKTIPFLIEDSRKSCAYCNGLFPPKVFANLEEPEIDHFISKTQDCMQAYTWENLFAVCSTCNSKRKLRKLPEGFDIIKPDNVKYTFAEYFLVEINYSDKKIFIKSRNNTGENTIEYLGLNKNHLPTTRFNEINYFFKNKPKITPVYYPYLSIIKYIQKLN